MKLNIEKRSASIGYDYEVTQNNENIFTAVSEKFLGFLNIKVWSNNWREQIVKIKNKRFTLLKPRYRIYYQNRKLDFRTISWYKRHFQFEYNESVYEIYGHHKTWKYSVYLNSNQIAWWDKKTKISQGPDLFEIDMNDNCNKELIVSFCLILDNLIEICIGERGDLFHGDGTVSLGFNKFGEIKAFDKSWTPKELNNGL